MTSCFHLFPFHHWKQREEKIFPSWCSLSCYAMTNLILHADILSLVRIETKKWIVQINFILWTHHVSCILFSIIFHNFSNEVIFTCESFHWLVFFIEFSSKDNCHFASMTNLSDENEEQFIYDTDGCLLFMQTTQSNLSLFNISSDSLIFDENQAVNIDNNRLKYSNSSTDLPFDTKKYQYRSTMIFNEDMFSSKNHPLQRWQGLELLNTYA